MPPKRPLNSNGILMNDVEYKEYRKKSKRVSYEKRISEGKCYHFKSCGNLAVDGRKRCQPCSDKQNGKTRKKREHVKLVEHKCTTCWIRPIDRIDDFDIESALCVKCKSDAKLNRIKLFLQGLCIDSCGRELKEGCKRCEVCLGKQNAVYYDRKEKGLCPRCGDNPPAEAHEYCQVCLDYGKVKSSEAIALAKEFGLCIVCLHEEDYFVGPFCLTCYLNNREDINERLLATNCSKCDRPKENTDSDKCWECLMLEVDIVKARREDRRNNGICVRGCKNIAMTTVETCFKCWIKQAAVTHLGGVDKADEILKLLETQKYSCPITGFKLIPGYNASIDHIVPKSRGGSINDTSNLHWVNYFANMLKGIFSLKEFLEFLPFLNYTVQQIAKVNSVSLEFDSNNIKKYEDMFLNVAREAKGQ